MNVLEKRIREIFRKTFGFRTLKTAAGAALAVLIAQAIHLDYAVNAGIIVILSVQQTKKKSRDLAIMRVGSTILALAIGSLVFSVVGFSALAFGIYLLLFIPSAVKLKFNDGIVPCSVLVSHLLASRSVAPDMLLNELMQMLIGAGIGFVLNYFMPSLEAALEKDIRQIDALMRSILLDMAESLRQPCLPLNADLFGELEPALEAGYARALQDAENRMSRDKTRYIRYMEIRDRQMEILRYMRRYFNRLREPCGFGDLAATLTEEIAGHFSDLIVPDAVIGKFRQSREQIRTMELPGTRDAFESRATLFEYLNDLEHLLEVRDMVAEEANAPEEPLGTASPSTP